MIPKTMACTPSECNELVKSGTHLSVYVDGSECTRRLRKQMAGPGIPIQLTENKVEMRDGSFDYPIKLPALQGHPHETIPAIVGILPDGTLVAWKMGMFFGKKKLILENGQLAFAEDFGSDLLDSPICEAACGEVQGMIGYKPIVYTCPGQPDKIVWQLCRTETCCCDEVALEDCEDCAGIDALINPPPIPP